MIIKERKRKLYYNTKGVYFNRFGQRWYLSEFMMQEVEGTNIDGVAWYTWGVGVGVEIVDNETIRPYFINAYDKEVIK